MEDILIYKDLREEFKKFCDENQRLSEVKAQRAAWRFGVYPSTSQVFEIHMCHTDSDCFHGLQFYEFCLLVSIIKYEIKGLKTKTEFIRRPVSNYSEKNKPRWDVFLGGACNPTTWRFDVAIPFLKEKNISFYNPQVSKWDASLIEIEEMAKQRAKVLFFVLDIRRTRGIASLVEASYLAGQGRNLILVLPSEVPNNARDVDVNEIDEIEFQSIHRSYLFIADLVQRQGIPIFTNVNDALKATRISLISNKMVQDMTEIDGVIPVKHSYVNVSVTMKILKTIFSSLDNESRDTLTSNDVKMGLSIIFDKQILVLIDEGNELFDFSDFCIEYSIMLLNSIQRKTENNIRCSSVHSIRQTSLVKPSDSTEDFRQLKALKSAINLRENNGVSNKAFYTLSYNLDDAYNSENKETVENKSSDNEILKKKSCINFWCCMKKFKFPSLSRLIRSSFRITKVSAEPQNEATVSNIEMVNDSYLNYSSIESEILQPSKMNYDVFLGGTCGDSTWRERIAIPLLQRSTCTYYDPQVNHTPWTRRLLPMEAEARKKSKVLVYVITNESTSTAALVEAAHFIGQKRQVVLHIQYLNSTLTTKVSNNPDYSPPLSPMAQFLQSSCSYPLSSMGTILPNSKTSNINDKVETTNNTDSKSSGFFSAMTTPISTSTVGLVEPGSIINNTNKSIVKSYSPNEFQNISRMSNKLSTSDRTGDSLLLSVSNITNSENGLKNSSLNHDEWTMSMNNISKVNPLPLAASKDHNRGRRYLVDVANLCKVPIFPTIDEAINQAIFLSQKPPSPFNGYDWTNKKNIF